MTSEQPGSSSPETQNHIGHEGSQRKNKRFLLGYPAASGFAHSSLLIARCSQLATHPDSSARLNHSMITIVSGPPRSGTSLMMQMLVAGGMTPLADGRRQAEADNPRGYLEWEGIKQLPKDPNCIAEGEGKVVKVISRLLLSLPAGHEYRVIFTQRPLPEVLASQDRMRRSGRF